MPSSCLSFRLIPALLLGLWIGGWGLPAGWAQEGQKPVEPTKFDSIDRSFFQIQDSSGYFWQTGANGALTSGETQYLQSGLNLVVDGVPFAPVAGEMVPPTSLSEGNITLTLRESRETVAVERALWFDPERGGVRVIDSVRNTSNAAMTVQIELRTTFPFGWQSLHDDSGEPLSKDPVLRMDPDDQGVLIHFSPAEGRHDTFVLCGPGGSAQQATLQASTNRREFTLRYEIVVAAGETTSLLHWILQASLPDVDSVSDLAARLILKGELIEPNVDRSKAAPIANFPLTSFPQRQSNPSRLRELFSLNDTLDRLGAQRRNADILWVNATTQLNGEISGAETIEIDDLYLGKQSLSVAEIAAIRGGNNGAQFPHVFLRDGRVLVGELELSKLSFTEEGSDTPQELGSDQFRTLFLRVSEKDGIPPPKTAGFVELIDGAVLAVTESAGIDFSWRSLLGSETMKGSEIREVQRFSDPAPQFRIVSKSGERISGFLTGGPLVLPMPGGEPIEIPFAYLSGYRESGLRERTAQSTEEVWIDFEEVPEAGSPDSGFLLTGNNVRAGSLKDETLLWKVDESLTSIPAEQIAAISRLPSAEEITFILALRSGETFTGRPVRAALNVDIGGSPRQIPIEKIYAYRAEQR